MDEDAVTSKEWAISEHMHVHTYVCTHGKGAEQNNEHVKATVL